MPGANTALLMSNKEAEGDVVVHVTEHLFLKPAFNSNMQII